MSSWSNISDVQYPGMEQRHPHRKKTPEGKIGQRQ